MTKFDWSLSISLTLADVFRFLNADDFVLTFLILKIISLLIVLFNFIYNWFTWKCGICTKSKVSIESRGLIPPVYYPSSGISQINHSTSFNRLKRKSLLCEDVLELGWCAHDWHLGENDKYYFTERPKGASTRLEYTSSSKFKISFNS